MIKTIAAGCFAVAALVTPQGAAAAALSVAPLYKAPPPAMAPAYNWSGFYLGFNGGGGLGHFKLDTSATRINTSGRLAGGTAGYNWQIGSAVLGLEGDIDWANLKGTNTSTLCPLGCSTSDTWLSTVRGRAGYAFGNVLPYVTGGLAVGDIRAATPGFAGATNTSAGWTAGGGLAVGDIRAATPGFAGATNTSAGWTAGAGLEVGLTGNWSAKAEYLYVDLGKFNCGTACNGLPTDNVSMHDNVVRAGVNYRFALGR